MMDVLKEAAGTALIICASAPVFLFSLGRMAAHFKSLAEKPHRATGFRMLTAAILTATAAYWAAQPFVNLIQEYKNGIAMLENLAEISKDRHAEPPAALNREEPGE